MPPLQQPRPPQQAFVAQQQQQHQQQPPAADGAGPWTTPGLYHPMAGLPSWDQQSLASTFSTASLNQPSNGEWYFDSGATSYMTSSHHNLSHACSQRYPTPSSIVVGNGALLPVTCTGSAALSPALRLNNILVSPHIIKNLISIRQFTTNKNCSVEFDPAGCSVKAMQIRDEIVRCNSSWLLYPLRLAPAHSLVAKAAVSIWHHVSATSVTKPCRSLLPVSLVR